MGEQGMGIREHTRDELQVMYGSVESLCILKTNITLNVNSLEFK